MGKKEKKEPLYSRWIELFLIGLAGMMVCFSWKEYELTKKAEEWLRAEQMNAKEKESGLTDTKTAGSETLQTASSLSEAQAIIPDAENPLEIRVLLMNSAQNSYVHEEVTVQSQKKIVITGAVSQEWEAGVPLTISQILPAEGTIQVRPEEGSEKITVNTMERNQGIPSYEGILEITRTEGGYRIINQVELETYLKYVVPSEMPASYPMEALKAQAVCARTYALRQMSEKRLETYGADVDDTVSFQVYNNISRQAATDQAVDETAGTIMCWENQPIQAYFFSTSCGMTSSDEVWTGEEPSPYLGTVTLSEQYVEAAANGSTSADISGIPLAGEELETYLLTGSQLDYEKDEPWYRWTVTFSWEDLVNRTQEEFPQIGTLQDLRITERSLGGAAKKLRLSGTTGEAELDDEYSIRDYLSPGGAAIVLKDGSENHSMKLLPSAYMFLEISGNYNQPEQVVIHGGGYGHGVGMSQNGAKHLAAGGMNWQQILSLFYKDITITCKNQ